MTGFAVPDWFDLPLTVASGQVFRWERQSAQDWIGVDGNTTLAYNAESRTCWTSGSVVRTSAYLGLLDSPEDRVERLKGIDDGIGEMAAAWRGLGMMQPECLSETIVSFICSSNNHLPRITGMVKRLAERFGTVVEANGVRYSILPTMEAIAKIRAEELVKLGFGYRAPFLVEAARRLCANADWEAELRRMDYGAARAKLMELPGIGRKVADCICLYGLGHSGAVPVDVHLWNAFRQRFQPSWAEGRLTDRRYAEIGDFLRQRFGSDAGYVQLLMYFDRQTESRRT